MDIARYSLAKPTNIWLLALVCVLGGIIALSNIGRLEDPAFTIKQVQVITQYPGASAEKVEQELTEQIEITLQKMPQLRRLISTSKPGVSNITVEVESHYNSSELPQIWDEVRKRLRDLKPSLPAGANPPTVYDDFGDVYGLYYALTAVDFTPHQMREFSRIMRRELLTLDGVAKVAVNGILEEQIVAEIDPYQIASLGLSFPDIRQVLNNNLRPVNGGRILVDGKKIRIPVAESDNKITEIGNYPLVVPGKNISIKLKDIVNLSLEPVNIPQSITRYNGLPAVTLAISAQTHVNIVEVGHAIKAKIAEVLATLPAGIEINAIYDQGNVVEKAVDGFIVNLEMSVAVVTLALCVFMGWRSGIVVGATLLVTVLGTILIMWLYDLRLQRISLGALVIAMGMLVDNAIVVAEGMMINMKQGRSAKDAASFIVRRTQWPLLGATIIGIAAFSGIGLSNDSTGEFLFSLYAVVLISLMLSWILAVTLTPLLGKYFYKQGSQEQAKAEKPSFIQVGYMSLLHKALKFRWVTVAVLFAVTIVAYGSFGMIKQGFFPQSNTPIFFIHYWGAQNQDIRITEQRVAAGEKIVLAHERVEAVSSFTGRGAERFTLVYGPESNNESYGFFLIRAYDSKEIPEIAKQLHQQLTAQDSAGDYYVQMIQFGPSSGAKLEARFSGQDPAVLRALAEQGLEIYRNDPGIKDVRQSWREKGIVLAPQYDDIAAGLAGVSRADFAEAIKFSTNGLNIGKYQYGDYSYPIVARAKDNPNVEDLENSLVWSSSQRQYIPFKQISSSVELLSEEVLINRRDRVRSISVYGEPVEGETAGRALSRIMSQIEAIELPDGYELEWGGEYESSRDAQQALGKGLPLGFLIMFLISVVLFGRVRQPLIIWLIVPMAIVGVVSGLLLTDMPFGFMSLLGFLSLFGMLIKNAIVLLEEIDLQIAEQKAPRIAIVEASASRFRPVSLAAITTILGMAPLLFDPFFADMSVTIMGGLTFATVLTLIAVPVLYSLFYKISFRKKEIKHKG